MAGQDGVRMWISTKPGSLLCTFCYQSAQAPGARITDVTPSVGVAQSGRLARCPGGMRRYLSGRWMFCGGWLMAARTERGANSLTSRRRTRLRTVA